MAAIWIYRNRLTGIIVSRFTVNIAAYLSPGTAIPLIHPHMTGITRRFTNIIISCPNGHMAAIWIYGNRPAGIVISRLTINIGAYLVPTATAPLIHPDMTDIILAATAIITLCPNGHMAAIWIYRNRLTGIIVSRFTVNIAAYLVPTATPLIHPHMTGIRSDAIIPISPNGHMAAIWIYGNRYAG